MRTRHRIPALFNLSMVDVLCCALGCVVLLWLINFREVKRRVLLAAGQNEQSVADARGQLERMAAELAALREKLGAAEHLTLNHAEQVLRAQGDRDQARFRTESALKERDQFRRDLETARQRQAQRDQEIAALKKDLAAAGDRVAQLTRERDGLSRELAGLKTDKARIEQRLVEKTQEQGSLAKELAALRASRDTLDRQLAQRMLAQSDLLKEIGGLKTANSALQDRVHRKTEESAILVRDLAAAEKQIAVLQGQVREKEARALAAARTADELADRYRDAEGRVKQLQGKGDLMNGLRAEADAYRTKLVAAEVRIRDLERDLDRNRKDLADASKGMQGLDDTRKLLARDIASRSTELADARLRIQELQNERKALIEQVARVQALDDYRFAGISLTGRRVVFLVDMSGSMELVDERTPAPDKWKSVRETLAKIMRSLPDLEKFQIILFSDKVLYPLGQEGRWIDYDPRTSVSRVTQELAAARPRGNTNMYIALEAAFRLRAEGLESIYFLSDGLPNIGPGLNPETSTKLKETERAELLARHVRQVLHSDWNRPQPNRPRVRINTIGFFYESPDVGAFLWALSRENEGSFVGMSKP